MLAGIRATDYPGGIIHGAYQPLTPPYAWLWLSTQAPPVAGHPVSKLSCKPPSEQQKNGPFRTV